MSISDVPEEWNLMGSSRSCPAAGAEIGTTCVRQCPLRDVRQEDSALQTASAGRFQVSLVRSHQSPCRCLNVSHVPHRYKCVVVDATHYKNGRAKGRKSRAKRAAMASAWDCDVSWGSLSNRRPWLTQVSFAARLHSRAACKSPLAQAQRFALRLGQQDYRRVSDSLSHRPAAGVLVRA